jgi:hypothetical protein
MPVSVEIHTEFWLVHEDYCQGCPYHDDGFCWCLHKNLQEDDEAKDVYFRHEKCPATPRK